MSDTPKCERLHDLIGAKWYHPDGTTCPGPAPSPEPDEVERVAREMAAARTMRGVPAPVVYDSLDECDKEDWRIVARAAIAAMKPRPEPDEVEEQYPIGEPALDLEGEWMPRCIKCGIPRGTLRHGLRCMAGFCNDPIAAMKPRFTEPEREALEKMADWSGPGIVLRKMLENK